MKPWGVKGEGRKRERRERDGGGREREREREREATKSIQKAHKSAIVLYYTEKKMLITMSKVHTHLLSIICIYALGINSMPLMSTQGVHDVISTIMQSITSTSCC